VCKLCMSLWLVSRGSRTLGLRRVCGSRGIGVELYYLKMGRNMADLLQISIEVLTPRYDSQV
jgi:hypothetical protein